MKTSLKILLIVAGILIIFRIALPYIVLRWANNQLNALEGYNGHIDDIDIRLYRGAYVIDSIYINKTDAKKNIETPLMAAKKIDLSVEWGALFDGKIVGELIFQDPYINFVRDRTEFADVKKDTADFRYLLNQFMPLELNRFEVNNGKIIYIDNTTQPKVHVQLDRAYIRALNLKSVKDTALLPATVEATAHIYEGNLHLKMKLDPLAEKPLFDMNVKMENTHLPELNDFFKAYAKIDVSKGTFGMYSEVASKDGKFKGYVKPVIKDLDVKGPEDRDDTFLQKAWENIVTVFGKILENPKADQIATKIPLEGSYEDTNAGAWTAVAELLRNAFVRALFPSIDHQINLASVSKEEKDDKGFFKKIFGKGNGDKK